MGWVEEGKRRAGTRQGLGFSIGQADLASGWAFDQLWHIWLPPGPSHCGATLGAKGAKCPVVLRATRWALSKPLFLANSTVLNLCAATLWLALGWTADALKKYLYKCGSVRLRVCEGSTMPKPLYFQCKNLSGEKNTRFLESHATLCVLVGERRSWKDCVTAKLQPRSCHFYVWHGVWCLTCHHHPVRVAFWQREEQEQAMFYRG